jgi:hypothetical protein
MIKTGKIKPADHLPAPADIRKKKLLFLTELNFFDGFERATFILGMQPA